MPRIRVPKNHFISNRGLAPNPYVKFCSGDLGWTMYEAGVLLPRPNSVLCILPHVLFLHRYHLKGRMFSLFVRKDEYWHLHPGLTVRIPPSGYAEGLDCAWHRSICSINGKARFYYYYIVKE